MERPCNPLGLVIGKCKPLTFAPHKCKPHKMDLQRRKPQKKIWDQEMFELFCKFGADPPPRMNFPSSVNQPQLFRLWDISQKFLFLINNMLVATSQQSGSSGQLMAVVPNKALDPMYQPIFMGLSDKLHTLNCVQSDGGQPQLQLLVLPALLLPVQHHCGISYEFALNEVRDIMDLYKANEEFKSFTFYSKTDGSDETCSFESAAFPGWFLSTSHEPNRPLGLSHRGTTDITTFYFQRTNSTDRQEPLF